MTRVCEVDESGLNMSNRLLMSKNGNIGHIYALHSLTAFVSVKLE